MFGQAKLIAMGLAAVAIVAVVGFGYLHYTSILSDLETARANEQKLLTATETQSATIKSLSGITEEWKEFLERDRLDRQRLAANQAWAAGEMRRLNEFFASRNLAKEARDAPSALQDDLNRRYARAMRLLHCATAGDIQCAGEGGEAPGGAGPAGPGAGRSAGGKVDGGDAGEAPVRK